MFSKMLSCLMKQSTQNYGGEKGCWAIWQWWERLKGHRSDAGLPLPKPLLYSAQAPSLKILPEDVQACIYLLLHESEGQSWPSLISCQRAWKVPTGDSWFETVRFHFAAAFTSPECSKQDTQWHHSACHSGSEPPSPAPRAAMGERPPAWDTAVLGVSKMGTSHFC